MDANALNIYTDGSSYQKPRRGGIGMLFIFPEHLDKENVSVVPFGYKQSTNNQMELKACVIALEESLKFEKEWTSIVIYTDSMYVVDNYPNAIFRWRSNGWKKVDGGPVLNAETWKELIKKVDKVKARVNIKRVKGHSKNECNEQVDKMAKLSAQKATKDPLYCVNVRRKKTNKKGEVGCVEIRGQKITIKIITSEYLKIQKISKYKYEVMSKGSPFYGLVDFVYSKKILRVGHEFYVEFNDNQKFPQVLKIYKDLTRKKGD